MLIVDLLPPGSHDPRGMHGIIQYELEDIDGPEELPSGQPLTVASYLADRPVEMFWEHLAVGDSLPEMPLFLRPDYYVNIPLESTYQAAYRGLPTFWRNVLEGKTPGTA